MLRKRIRISDSTSLTCTFGPTFSFMRRTSSTVAPTWRNLSKSLQRSGRFSCNLAEAIFSSFVSRQHSKMRFGGDTHLVADAHDGAHLFFDVCPVASFYLRDVEHIVNFVCAICQRVFGLKLFLAAMKSAQGKAMRPRCLCQFPQAALSRTSIALDSRRPS